MGITSVRERERRKSPTPVQCSQVAVREDLLAVGLARSWDGCWVGCRWGRGAARYCVADAVCREPRWVYFRGNSENPNPVDLSMPLFLVGFGGVGRGRRRKRGKRFLLNGGELERPLTERLQLEQKRVLAMMNLSTTRDEKEPPVVF